MQQSTIFERSEQSTLKKIPVESFPVKVDKKLSIGRLTIKW